MVKIKILVGFESSGVVRQAFRERGHDAWSCDLLPADDGSPFHFQCDVRQILDRDWSLGIFHPPCTYLCSSGLHWNKRVLGREEQTIESLRLVRLLMNTSIDKICIENPVGRIGTAIRPADVYLQPYQFGHDASKRTGLWLKNLPLLVPDPKDYVEPRVVEYKGKLVRRWANQTDSGQNKLAPSADRWKLRAETYEGIAKAMAQTWG